ncbi:hypothetical protein BJ878DRAFT_510042 [Calycina marina]|uniref:Pentatricopeptide repeat domain-containing protein n=1 Tax=Calycina marina TaxID=1763456 RepID=A0A9P7Z1A5_9HELO|nr:hypothetical protein BJ878DRAFT_510042 [Calycina marina]
MYSMRPALQRLLRRPASLDLLRHVVGSPIYSSTPETRGETCYRKPSAQYSCHGTSNRAVYSTLSSNLIRDEETDVLDELEAKSHLHLLQCAARKPHNVSTLSYGQWDDLPAQHLRYESELEDPRTASRRPSRPKLMDNPDHRDDLSLWTCLMDYRQRLYGIKGVYPFWKAVLRGDLKLSTDGPYAARLWNTFLKLAFQDEEVSMGIADVADGIQASTKKHWPPLYTTIIQHYLLDGYTTDNGDAWHDWHRRLHLHYAPEKKAFKDMCRKVTYLKGHMRGLFRIYLDNSHRDIYSAIVPTLCAQGDFENARIWHYRLLKNGDAPVKSRDVEPLFKFLLWYNPKQAIQLTDGLAAKGFAYLPDPKSSSSMSKDITQSESLKEGLKVSRTMMNIIHGETFGITAKEYNDDYGAKWFATTWVSLDISINTIGALGMDWIGPMSLQAIALRERDAEKINRRIDQLQDIGISIGTALYSRAIEFFARNNKQELLNTLITSDLHPDALEDRKVQDELMISYARDKDWPHYRLILTLRFLQSKTDPIDTHNVMIRSFATVGDTSAMLSKLRKMQIEGTPVQAKTVKYLMTNVMRRRNRGKRPTTQYSHQARYDLDQAIELLKGIMLSGNFVPVTLWREILRRLGMLLRLDDLAALCDFLATWYGPTCEAMFLDPKVMHRWHRYQTPDKMITSHPLHPLAILFSKSFQRAIVEWGFIKSLDQNLRPWESIPQIDAGIQILKQLNRRGVYIHFYTLRKSILDRLIALYGSADSNRRRNREAKRRNPLQFLQALELINQAVGRELFQPGLLLKYLQAAEHNRLQRRDLKGSRNRSTRDPRVLRIRAALAAANIRARTNVLSTEENCLAADYK